MFASYDHIFCTTFSKQLNPFGGIEMFTCKISSKVLIGETWLKILIHKVNVIFIVPRAPDSPKPFGR